MSPKYLTLAYVYNFPWMMSLYALCVPTKVNCSSYLGPTGLPAFAQTGLFPGNIFLEYLNSSSPLVCSYLVFKDAAHMLPPDIISDLWK